MSMNIEVDEFLLYSWEHEEVRENCKIWRKNKINGKFDDWDINIGCTVNGA